MQDVRGQQPKSALPTITIRRDGSLALNPAAHELLRPAAYGQLSYEPATNTLTITPATSDTPRCLSLVRDGTAGLIRARHFWRRSGIAEELHYGRRYPAVAVASSVTGGSSGTDRCLTVQLSAAE